MAVADEFFVMEDLILVNYKELVLVLVNNVYHFLLLMEDAYLVEIQMM